MNHNFFKAKAKEIMTYKPYLIKENELISNAISIMNTKKITCLFVIKNKSSKIPVGIIHIHDCIRYAD